MLEQVSFTTGVVGTGVGVVTSVIISTGAGVVSGIGVSVTAGPVSFAPGDSEGATKWAHGSGVPLTATVCDGLAFGAVDTAAAGDCAAAVARGGIPGRLGCTSGTQ